jgi:hypothetical protein
MIWENAEECRFHYQETDVERAKAKLLDKTERFKIAQLIVEDQVINRNNLRFFLWLNDRRKIIGDFTMEMFKSACTEYLLTHDRELKRFQIQRDNNGRKKFTFDQALQQGVERLVYLYWGNTEINRAA